MSEDNGGNSFLWFLAGLGVGAVVGVLYAPKSGAETRAELCNKFEEGREFVSTKFEDGREFVTTKAGEVRVKAEDWAQRGKEVLDQQKQQVRSAFQAGKQAYKEATAAEGPTEV
jgi:gas vesicle protein